jgi:hypothetical protein
MGYNAATTARTLIVCAACAVAVACSSNGGTVNTRKVDSCGFAPPVPAPALFLAFPIPSSTSVPVTIAELVVQGDPQYIYGPITVSLASATAPIVSDIAPSPAPSPLPSPIASPFGTAAYYAVPIPTLAPSTTYTASINFLDWSDNPPVCRAPSTQQIGSFSTGP